MLSTDLHIYAKCASFQAYDKKSQNKPFKASQLLFSAYKDKRSVFASFLNKEYYPIEVPL